MTYPQGRVQVEVAEERQTDILRRSPEMQVLRLVESRRARRAKKRMNKNKNDGVTMEFGKSQN